MKYAKIITVIILVFAFATLFNVGLVQASTSVNELQHRVQGGTSSDWKKDVDPSLYVINPKFVLPNIPEK